MYIYYTAADVNAQTDRTAEHTSRPLIRVRSGAESVI